MNFHSPCSMSCNIHEKRRNEIDTDKDKRERANTNAETTHNKFINFG